MANPETNSHPFYQSVRQNVTRLNQCLCIGLDPDPKKLPSGYSQTVAGVEAFLNDIISITKHHCVAYKPNISFFEALGLDGLHVLERVMKRIPSHVPTVLDAKRGDIGNTSAMQARYIFDYFGASATTVHPYMGGDSVLPFIEHRDRYTFILALTSNVGARDIEKLALADGRPLYSAVVDQCLTWHSIAQNVGLVVGATQDEMAKIRKQTPDQLFLIPGVGAQGGDYHAVKTVGQNQDGLALINMSRGILYASPTKSDMESKILQIINAL
ncbi:MAG: orotidine-5'-phosphate decarboxylase [bacterium]|nr:orotidine-5'-phosphate decarboxylase [bacterium]